METIKERLIKYLEYKGIGQNKFEKQCGISNGYISHMQDNLGKNQLMKIIGANPELNRDWLLYGDGNMLVDGNVNGNNNAIGNNASVDVRETDALKMLITEMSEQRKESNQHISRLLSIIETMQK